MSMVDYKLKHDGHVVPSLILGERMLGAGCMNSSAKGKASLHFTAQILSGRFHTNDDGGQSKRGRNCTIKSKHFSLLHSMPSPLRESERFEQGRGRGERAHGES